MAAKKTSAGSKLPAQKRGKAASGATTSAGSTVSAPARRAKRPPADDPLTEKMAGTDSLVGAMPFNPNKGKEYGRAALEPQRGATIEVPDARLTVSTLTEGLPSNKVGSGKPNLGLNPGNLPLDRVRADATGQVLTTNQGVPVADNQHSLNAGLRGPALLEDFILREKIISTGS
jgi:catalase